MFRLVDDVEAYPEFLPWCADAVIEREEGDTMVATLELHKGGLSRRFTTRNIRRPHSAIDLSLVGGPFRQLSGGWRFAGLGGTRGEGGGKGGEGREGGKSGKSGEGVEGGCRVSLELEFAFDSRLVDMMFGPFFEETCNSLVDAFTRRAADVYGERRE